MGPKDENRWRQVSVTSKSLHWSQALAPNAGQSNNAQGTEFKKRLSIERAFLV